MTKIKKKGRWGRLTQLEQQVLRRRFRDNLTDDEIAVKLGITKEEVREIVFNALKKLSQSKRR